MRDIVTGRASFAGQLTAADPPLLRLQSHAGGKLGDVIAVPALFGIVRLARTLGIMISRTIVCASGDHDVELLVRARPDGDGIGLAIGGWLPRPPRKPWLQDDIVHVRLPDQFENWTWTTDANLEIVDASGPAAAEVLGQTLPQVFRLIEDEFEGLPILQAAVAHDDFVNQPATMRAYPAREVILAGRARRDAAGKFEGFDGTTDSRKGESDTPNEAVPLATINFTERLDAALRHPLSRIVANADTISAQVDGPLRRDYADYAGDIASAARHLLTLVDDLSDLQAVERPDFHVDSEAVDLIDLAQRAAGLLKVRAADRQVRIDCPTEQETLSAKGDFRRVLQILVNLIGNAIRYSPDAGMIWIRTERDGGSAVLIVADQGKGISVEDQERIFNKFERVDSSESGGSGLGLFISRRLARAMGGDIVVDSAMGQGARFVLTLPLM